MSKVTISVEPNEVASYPTKAFVPDLPAGSLVYVEADDEFYMEDGD